MSKLSKKQEKKRQQRRREREKNNPATLAYHGNKYRTEELVVPMMAVETAILEAFIVLDRELTDHDVSRALVSLINQVRHGDTIASTGSPHVVTDDRAGTVALLVRARWAELADGLPSRDNLIGILRSILGSVQNHKTMNPDSRHYLNFIEGFLAELGVRIQMMPELTDEAPGMGDSDAAGSEFKPLPYWPK